MKQIIILLLILIFTSCTPCERYYCYSKQQESELKVFEGDQYKTKIVNDSTYTQMVTSKAAFELFKDAYPDMKIVVIGCPEDLKFK